MSEIFIVFQEPVAVTFPCKLSHSRSLGSALAGGGLLKVFLYGQDLEPGSRSLVAAQAFRCRFSSGSVQQHCSEAAPAERPVHQLLSKALLERNLGEFPEDNN